MILDFPAHGSRIRVEGSKTPEGERVTHFWLHPGEPEPTLSVSIEPLVEGLFLDAEALLSSASKPSLFTLLLPWLKGPEQEIQRFWCSFSEADASRQALWDRTDKSGLRGRDLGVFIHDVYRFPDLSFKEKVTAAESIVGWILEGMGQDPVRFRSLYEAMNGEYHLPLPGRLPPDYTAEGISYRIMVGKALLPVRACSSQRHELKARLLECFANSIQRDHCLPTKKKLRELEGLQSGSEAARAFRETGLGGLPEAKG